MKIPISNIIIPTDRQRKMLTDTGIKALAVSLQANGQLQPVIVVKMGDIREPDDWLWTVGLKHKTAKGIVQAASDCQLSQAGSDIEVHLEYKKAFITARGPYPQDMELDHLCREPKCCNPRHLQPVTHSENLKRRDPEYQFSTMDYSTTYRLIAGFRRITAAKQLGWSHIDAVFPSHLTPERVNELTLAEIEFEENIQRENLSWQDECDAKKRILEIRADLYGETAREVAQHTGLSKTSLWEDARLAKAMEEMPELRQAKNKTQANNRLRLIQHRHELEEVAKRQARGAKQFSDEITTRVHLGDCLEVMREWNDECVHCVVTDPPYGIQLEQNETKKGTPHPVIYEDDHYDIMDLLALAAKECYRVLAANSHAYFFFDIKAYCKVFKLLGDAGFTVDPIPLFWNKNIRGQVNSPDSRFGNAYEVCFFCRKGQRALLKQGQANVLNYDVVPPKKKIHPTEKPVALLRQLIETSTVAGEVVLDPFGGSGSTAEAALQVGRNFITIEKDPAFHAGILERLSNLSKGRVVELSEEEEEDLK